MKGTHDTVIIPHGTTVHLTGNLTVRKLIIRGSGQLRENGHTVTADQMLHQPAEPGPLASWNWDRPSPTA